MTRNSYGRLLRSSDRARAIDETRRAIELQAGVDPDHPRSGVFHANLGQLLRSHGDLDGAREAFTVALGWASALPDEHSRKGFTYRDLGRVLYESGEYERSAGHFGVALEGEPGNPGILRQLALSQYSAEEFEPLRAWFSALYEVLLGAAQGPRFGGFIALYGVAETIALIKRVLAGEDISGG